MALLFIAPATIGFLIFYLYPTIRGFYFSLTKYTLLGTPHFIGFDNFVKIANDKLFWNALVVTLEYVLLNIVFQTLLAVGLAVLMRGWSSRRSSAARSCCPFSSPTSSPP